MSAYLIVNCDIVDTDVLQEYLDGGAAVILEGGGRVIVSDNESVTLEGDPGRRTVVIEYPSKQAAVAAYESDTYQAVVGKRLAATSRHHGIIVEGVE